MSGSRYCFFHDPTRSAERRQARSAGGRARHGRSLNGGQGGDVVVLASVADVVLLLERAARDLLSLENSISRARALAYVGSIAVKALEVGDLEERISALEQKLGV